MQQQPYQRATGVASDLPAESPKSRHNPQEVKDRILPLVNVALSPTLKSFSTVTTAYNTSTLHTEIMIWNRTIALSRYNTALFYSANVLHLYAGSLEPTVPSPTKSLFPRLLRLDAAPTLRTSNSEQRRPQTFSAAGYVFVAFLRSAFQYNENPQTDKNPSENISTVLLLCVGGLVIGSDDERFSFCSWELQRKWHKRKTSAYLNDLIILF